MSEIIIKNLNKNYGKNHVIKDVSLDIESQSFTVLVGNILPQILVISFSTNSETEKVSC